VNDYRGIRAANQIVASVSSFVDSPVQTYFPGFSWELRRLRRRETRTIFRLKSRRPVSHRNRADIALNSPQNCSTCRKSMKARQFRHAWLPRRRILLLRPREREKERERGRENPTPFTTPHPGIEGAPGYNE